MLCEEEAVGNCGGPMFLRDDILCCETHEGGFRIEEPLPRGSRRQEWVESEGCPKASLRHPGKEIINSIQNERKFTVY